MSGGKVSACGHVGLSRRVAIAVHAALCVAAVLSTGCAAVVIGAAGGTAGAVYVLGKLQEELDHPVPAVHEAVLNGLKDLDLTPSEDRADKLTAHVESELADGRHVWIDVDSLGSARSKLTIRVGLVGDESRSRQILDAIKRRLPSPRT